jgi:hypothetical protein
LLLPFCLLALLVFGSSNPVLAQEQESSASLEETLTFLNEMIETDGRLILSEEEKSKNGYTSWKFHFNSINGCSVKNSF